MNIREAEEILGINRSTIEYYAKCGLIKEQGNRFQNLDESVVNSLKKILILRRMGISIRDLQQLSKGSIKLDEVLSKTKQKAEKENEAHVLALSLLEKAKDEKDYDSFSTDAYWQSVHEAGPFFEDTHDIYTTVSSKKKTKKDWILPLVIILSVVIVLAISIPTGWMLYRSYSYRTFVTNFSSSLADAKFKGSLAVQHKTYVKRTSGDDVTILYNMVLDAGNGSPVSEMPEEDDVILISFGEGSAVIFAPDEDTDGTIVRYIKKDGGDFIYSTEEMKWNDVLGLLFPAELQDD